VEVKQKSPYNKFYYNEITFNHNIFYTFNDISSYIYEDDEEEIELCFINCQMNRANRTKTLRLDYIK